MRPRHLMFVLPNLFTVSSIFCGFFALSLCSQEAKPQQLYTAALAIFFGTFFDGFDGRVARLTKTQSQFGVELDSLADVITFGVAPGMLAYKFALQNFGLLGVFIGFVYAACAALRLARFNVLAQRSSQGGAAHYFVGLPTPLAAAAVISMIISHRSLLGDVPLNNNLKPLFAVWLVLLSALMVSTVRYRTFKHVKLNTRTIVIFGVILVTGATIATVKHPAWVLLVFVLGYLTFGLIESFFMVLRWLKQKRVETEAEPEDEIEELIRSQETDVDEQEAL